MGDKGRIVEKDVWERGQRLLFLERKMGGGGRRRSEPDSKGKPRYCKKGAKTGLT